MHKSKKQQNTHVPAPNVRNTKRRNGKGNEKKKEQKKDIKFSDYISKEEVNIGLENHSLLEGTFRINPKDYTLSYVSNNNASERDIYIKGFENQNRALDGDTVVVKIIHNTGCEDIAGDKNRMKGKVVYIKEKVHNRRCVGFITDDLNEKYVLFSPRDRRIPRFHIPLTSCPFLDKDLKSYENTLFLAEISDWPNTNFITGKNLRALGQSNDITTETRAVLAETDLDVTPYGPEVEDFYPQHDYTIPDDEIKKRVDCRKMCIFSIDALTNNYNVIADAISCRRLENGNYEVGVHISDVVHFLTENTTLDKMAAKKATTIYSLDKAYYMLPDNFRRLCSLSPGVDRLAFSVFWEITNDAKVVSHAFSKTIIHSCCQMDYDHAQAILEDREDAEANFPEICNGFYYENIYTKLKKMQEFAAVLRKERFENGAFEVTAQPKVNFHLNASNGLPETYYINESKKSNELLEEFMLLANITVAKRIYNDHPNLALLECHPSPKGNMLKQLAEDLKPLGVHLKISSAGDLSRSLLPHMFTDKGKTVVLNLLYLKTMSSAKYFCAGIADEKDFQNYSLNIPIFTHFTSPIDNYVDIVVQRLLAASLNKQKPNWGADKVRMIAEHCNKQRYNAKKVINSTRDLYIMKYIEMKSPFLTEAAVTEVTQKYIDVIIVPLKIRRRILLESDSNYKFRYIKNHASVKLSKVELTWQATNNLKEIKQVIQIFSLLPVEMTKGKDIFKDETKLVRPQ